MLAIKRATLSGRRVIDTLSCVITLTNRCAGLLVLAITVCVAQGQRTGVFYAVGSELGAGTTTKGVHEAAHQIPGDNNLNKRIRLYEVDASTLNVLRSLPVDIDSPHVGMLTGDRKTIVLVDGSSAKDVRILLLSASDFVVHGHMDISMSMMPVDANGDRVDCLDHIFVHPVTGNVYFSCRVGIPRGPALSDFFEVDLFTQKIFRPELPYPVLFTTPVFQYDPTRRWLFVDGSSILDANNHLIGSVEETRKERPLGDSQPVNVIGVEVPGRPGLSGVDDVALLPNGYLVLLFNFLEPPSISYTAVVALYDPEAHKILRTWTDENTYTCIVRGRIHGVRYENTPMSCLYSIQDAPVPSPDGSRLFGVEQTGTYKGTKPLPQRGVIWGAKTLNVVRSWPLPEPESFDCDKLLQGVEAMPRELDSCFIPAPDGRSMWYFGQSGKIYRLDDHTGELLGEVKLPFHLISLIREP